MKKLMIFFLVTMTLSGCAKELDFCTVYETHKLKCVEGVSCREALTMETKRAHLTNELLFRDNCL
jgi:uncharacterized protein YceK